jgi:hypothetical protein
MLILIGMLLVGLLAGVWGFMMCFLPVRWDRLTEAIGGFTPSWMYPGPERIAPIMKFANRAAGFVICAGGCWFAYFAVAGIYRILRG